MGATIDAVPVPNISVSTPARCARSISASVILRSSTFTPHSRSRTSTQSRRAPAEEGLRSHERGSQVERCSIGPRDEAFVDTGQRENGSQEVGDGHLGKADSLGALGETPRVELGPK